MGKKIQCIGRYAMDGVTLGKGNFAHVELATHGVVNIKVAVKIIDTRKIKDEYQRANLHREARIMAILRHPNIIRLYETLKATTLYCLVTEYARGGELLAYIKSQKDQRLPESCARPFIRQLVSAVHYIHERGIVHRDLKMENIMLDEKQKNIKLIDFGLSNIYKANEPLKTRCGSPEYAAPELFVVGKTYGPEIDIWSIGIVMYAMVIGRLPFFSPFKDEYHRQRMLQHIQRGMSQFHEREMQFLTAECRGLIHQLIEPNPELRLPLCEIETHAWTTKCGKCPFVAFTTPQRNRLMRSQVINELATMLDMKRNVICDTVKEQRADELSAMFNLKMDQLKQQQGLFDIDHTKGWPEEQAARSRSNERTRQHSPEQEEGRNSLKPDAASCSLQVSSKLAASRKSGAGTKAKPKNRSTPANSSRCSSGTSEHQTANRQLHSDVVAAPEDQTQLFDAANHDETDGHRAVEVTSLLQQPHSPGAVTMTTDSTERRPRLNRTLDLSVPQLLTTSGTPKRQGKRTTPAGITTTTTTTAPGTVTGRHRPKSPVTVTAISETVTTRLQQPPPDYATATAVSDVNPVSLMSAKTSSTATSTAATSATTVALLPSTTPSKVVAENHASAVTSATTTSASTSTAAITTTTSLVTAVVVATAAGLEPSSPVRNEPPIQHSTPTSRARRPSSLPYSLRPVTIGLKKSTARTFVPSEEVTKPRSSHQSQPTTMPPPQPPPQPLQPEVTSRTGQPSRVIAPTATPEDSFVDGPSSSGQGLLSLTDTFAAAIADSGGATASVINKGLLESTAVDHGTTNASSSAAHRLAENQPSECLYASVSSSSFYAARKMLASAVHGSSRVADNTSATVLPNGKNSSSNSSSSTSGVGRIQRVLSDARHRLFGQRGSAKRSVRKNATDVTAGLSDGERSQPVLVPTDVCERQTAETNGGFSNAEEAGATCDINATQVPVSGAINFVSDQLEEVSRCNRVIDDAIGNGSDAVLDAIAMRSSLQYGLSPSSPSYDRRHVRFSHIGSHALDVFFSPEESDYEEFGNETDYEDEMGKPEASRVGGAESRSSLRPVIWRPLASCSSAVLMAANSPPESFIDGDRNCLGVDLNATKSRSSLRSATSSANSSSTIVGSVDLNQRGNGTAGRHHGGSVGSSSTITRFCNTHPSSSDLRNSCQGDTHATVSSASLISAAVQLDNDNVYCNGCKRDGLSSHLGGESRGTVLSHSLNVDVPSAAWKASLERMQLIEANQRPAVLFADTTPAAGTQPVGNNGINTNCLSAVGHLLSSNGSLSRGLWNDIVKGSTAHNGHKTTQFHLMDDVNGTSLTSSTSSSLKELSLSNHRTARLRPTHFDRKQVQWNKDEQEHSTGMSINTNGDARKYCTAYDFNRTVSSSPHCSTLLTDQHKDKALQSSNHIVSNS